MRAALRIDSKIVDCGMTCPYCSVHMECFVFFVFLVEVGRGLVVTSAVGRERREREAVVGEEGTVGGVYGYWLRDLVEDEGVRVVVEGVQEGGRGVDEGW